MDLKMKIKLVSAATLFALPFALSSVAVAAKAVNLSHQPVAMLQTLTATPGLAVAANPIAFTEVSRNTDKNQTLHVRLKETYLGHPVWGGDAILHIPHGAATGNTVTAAFAAAKASKSSMNGIVYQGIDKDLIDAPATALTEAQAQKALQTGIRTYQQSSNNMTTPQDQSVNLIVYLDDANKAHWAYLVTFSVEAAKESALPAKPAYILDAASMQVYEQWDEIKTAEGDPGDGQTVAVTGGGFGGNTKMGEVTYDGQASDLPTLSINRSSLFKRCYLENSDVIVKNYSFLGLGSTVSFSCSSTDNTHNGVYWDGSSDSVNGAYSPSNDALFEGAVIKNMYKQWYNQEVLMKDGQPMLLTMVVHRKLENAYWDGSKMTFGDGGPDLYPLTSLDIAAHEISHGFTAQHSGLTGMTQAGGLNEAFSDMAGEAAKLFAYGSNNYLVGPEVMKAANGAIRYMAKPSTDCNGGTPGQDCSIDNMKQYTDKRLDVHYTCGVFNRAFYLIATAPGWDAKKAFEVMLQANMSYWTSNTTFAQAACGVMSATKDLSYDTKVVSKAFTTVGLDTSSC